MKILIVDDEDGNNIANSFGSNKTKKPFETKIVRSLVEAKDLIKKGDWSPEFVVLDAMFPENKVDSLVDAEGRPLDIRNEFNAGRLLDFITQYLSDSNHRVSPFVVLVSGQTEAASYFDEIEEWLKEKRIFDVLPKGISWEFFQAILRNKVEHIREILDRTPEKLVLNLKELTISVGKNKTRISGTRMLIMLIYALQNGKPISDDELKMEIFDDAFYRLNGKKYRFHQVTRDVIAENLISGVVLAAYNSLKKVFELKKGTKAIHKEEYSTKMTVWRSKINHDVLKKKADLSRKYFIQNKGDYGDARFCFEVEVEIKD